MGDEIQRQSENSDLEKIPKIKKGFELIMEMQNEIEYEYSQFLNDMKESGFIFGAYMDETEYEDEYSHNTIGEAMEILQDKIRAYLHENRPGEFVVSSGWCVHVMTPERARQSRISEQTIEDYLVF